MDNGAPPLKSDFSKIQIGNFTTKVRIAVDSSIVYLSPKEVHLLITELRSAANDANEILEKTYLEERLPGINQ